MDSRALTRRIAFSLIKKPAADCRALLEAVGGVDRFFELPQDELFRLSGTTDAICSEVVRRRLLTAAERECRFMEQHNLPLRFVGDEDYPFRLSQCPDAPIALYCSGKAELLDGGVMIAIVGTRNSTAYGIGFVRELVNDLSKTLENPVIISGLAYGIDAATHRAALDAGVPTVAVVAHGLRTIYPADHRDLATRIVHDGGAIITEYNSEAPIHKGNFLARNRIVAGLSDAVIVVESDSRGGALVTARLAASYDRLVGAVPGRTTDRYSRGCNALIQRQVATIIRNADDLIEALNITARPKEGEQQTIQFPTLTPEMERIVEHLRRNPGHTANDMARELDIPYSTMSARLMEMEMDDLITALPGGKFNLNV